MNAPYPPAPVTLIGKYVELHPLRKEHTTFLEEAVADGKLWELWFTSVPTPANMGKWIEKANEEEYEGVSLPFVVKRKSDGKFVGSTRFMNIEKDVRRLEIGHTWYSKSAQKTEVNTECKLLLLDHAFENLKCIAVELRTHIFNVESRKAIQKLGAKEDGILRNHRIMPNGTIRDTVVYSIIETEWPTVKTNLQYRLS
ncbi:GNAT family N-acetyltransferase [Leptospira ilyithenensis]|uniref:N-acetyltransferase n=1 Tax=Leptospira ilyithenensis TaxID=2484901 RepID=A0A4R9LTX7_9LEPT|nr:GNAT family protein [Leptospira ilyithenensis]TGN10623.1 N-acetyltransferase [Leptospira ilyithenensis]